MPPSAAPPADVRRVWVSLLPLLSFSAPLSTLGLLEYECTRVTHPFSKPTHGFRNPGVKFQTPAQVLEGSSELAFAFLPIAQQTPMQASILGLGVTSSGRSSLMSRLKAPTAAYSFSSKHVSHLGCGNCLCPCLSEWLKEPTPASHYPVQC